jgi:hypothetical protein
VNGLYQRSATEIPQPTRLKRLEQCCPADDLSVDVTRFQGFGTPVGLFRLEENVGLPCAVQAVNSRMLNDYNLLVSLLKYRGL